jgi:hypothetical protein
MITVTTWFQIQELYNTRDFRIKQINSTEWLFIKAVLIENYDKAKQSAELVKHKVVTDVAIAYGDNMTLLRYDLDHPSTKGQLYQIIHKNIAGVYINKNNDSNDPFVFTSYGIIGDLSLDCSPSATEVTFRTWDQEYAQQANQNLARIAVKSIVGKISTPIFWEFLKSENPDHRIIPYMSLSELEKTFYAEGIKGLKTYEFLQYSTIFDNEDLVGRKLRTTLGLKNSDVTIVYIVQGFNLLDALEKNHPEDILEAKNHRHHVIIQTDASVKHSVLNCIAMIFTLLSLLVATLIMVPMEEKKE